jgi:hypothetical protein
MHRFRHAGAAVAILATVAQAQDAEDLAKKLSNPVADRAGDQPERRGAGQQRRLGSQHVSLTGGLRYWADGPESGPHDLGLRLVLTLLFPK